MKFKNNLTTAIKNKGAITKKIALVFLIGTVFSQSYAQYEMNKITINNGGSIISGGNYKVNSSIGQTDASNTLRNGNYTLNGGFWHENNDLIFKNNFE